MSQTEYSACIFLSYFDDLEAKIRKPEDTPAVINSFNYICLLNLPRQMQTHGPLRDLWEGKVQGEGFLPRIKQLHSQGTRTGWACNLLRSVLRERSLDNLLGSSSRPSMPLAQDVHDLSNFSGDFFTYECLIDIQETLEETRREKKKGLSVILLCDSSSGCARIFAACGTKSQVVELVMNKTVEAKEKFGVHYYSFVVKNKDIHSQWKDVLSGILSPRVGFAVLLPILDPEESQDYCLFGAFSSNWKILCPSNSLIDLTY